MSEDDVRTILADPLVMVGSDGPCVAPYGITGQGKPHPRLYGTFPRVLGHYARDLGLLGLPQAIHKMTGGAAAALGLADRGTIAAGNAADLVLFDPETIADRASFDDPHQYPEGIEMVIVNGVVVIDQGEHTGALPGHLLRRRGESSRKRGYHTICSKLYGKMERAKNACPSKFRLPLRSVLKGSSESENLRKTAALPIHAKTAVFRRH